MRQNPREVFQLFQVFHLNQRVSLSKNGRFWNNSFASKVLSCGKREGQHKVEWEKLTKLTRGIQTK
jgi:hypothetical protein